METGRAEPTGQITRVCVWLAVPPGLLRPTLCPTSTLEEIKRGCQRMEEERSALDKRTQGDIWISNTCKWLICKPKFFRWSEFAQIPEFLNASAPRTLT